METSYMENFNIIVKKNLSFLDNENIYAGLLIALTLYAGIAPRLPKFIMNLFNNSLFKIVIFFLIICVSIKNVTLAIITTIAVITTLHTVCSNNLNSEMMSVMDNDEKMRKFGKYTNSVDGLNQLPSAEMHGESTSEAIYDDNDNEMPVQQIAEHNNGDIVWINEDEQEYDMNGEQPNALVHSMPEEEKIQQIMVKKAKIENKIDRQLTLKELKALCTQIIEDEQNYQPVQEVNAEDNVFLTEQPTLRKKKVSAKGGVLPGYDGSNFAMLK